MLQFENLMAVYSLLNKSNCMDCSEKTCMSFAAAVFLGKRPLGDCPHVEPDILSRYGSYTRGRDVYQEDLEEAIEPLKHRFLELNMERRAEEIGAIFKEGKLTMKIMGKDFSLDREGKVHTLVHVNSWILVTSLRYIVESKGRQVQGKWLGMRDLPGGRDWNRFFEHQCEKPLKNLADTHPDLFEDLVRMFGGREVQEPFDADVALVLSPLPLVPLAICYWYPEDGMESRLKLFFDETGEENLGIEGLYLLGTGITQMFSKLTKHHGFTT